MLAAATVAPGVAAAESEGSDEDGGLKGSWLSTISFDGNPVPFGQVVTGYASGGVVTNLDAGGGPTGLGTWKNTGHNGFAFTFYAADTDQSGKPTGGLDKVRGVGTRTGNHISGKFAADGFDGAGHPTFSLTGTFDGQRIVVEAL